MLGKHISAVAFAKRVEKLETKTVTNKPSHSSQWVDYATITEAEKTNIKGTNRLYTHPSNPLPPNPYENKEKN